MSAIVAGVALRQRSHLVIALTDIKGIGKTTAQRICQATGLDRARKVETLTEDELNQLRAYISEHLTVEGDLVRATITHIEAKKRVGSRCGIRHRKGLPVRGQRTRTNSRTARRLGGGRRKK